MQAWLQLTPKSGTHTNGEQYGEVLPDIPDEWSHLPVFLTMIGTVCQSFGGLSPLTYQEIEAWARMSNIKIGRFEAHALRSMSAVYASASSDTEAPCPIQSDEISDAISQVHAASWMSFAK